MELNIRNSLRKASQMRPIECELNYAPWAEGSCLIKVGNTHVLCTASVENTVPPFIRNTGRGWVTAEYAMLPRSTHQRIPREVNKGKPGGRTQEIQRLIGRSLRAITALDKLGERQIIVDCDVIRADGGTRTAAITGGYIALHLAVQKLVEQKIIRAFPLISQVAAVSCGVVKGKPLLDLEYSEDSEAEVDANFIMSGSKDLIEVQATGEKRPFAKAEYDALYELAVDGIEQLLTLQKSLLRGVG